MLRDLSARMRNVRRIAAAVLVSARRRALRLAESAALLAHELEQRGRRGRRRSLPR